MIDQPEGPFFVSPENLSVDGVHVVIGIPPSPNVTKVVDWSLSCEGTQVTCRGPLLAGRDHLPVRIDIDGLALDPGSLLKVSAQAVSEEPAKTWEDGVQEKSPLAGTIRARQVVANATPPVPVPILRDGITDPCLYVECDGGVFGHALQETLPDDVVALDLTMTWTAASEVDRVLTWEFWASCTDTSSCTRDFEVTGASPLQVKVAGLDMPASYFRVLAPAGPSRMALRTEVHIEGVAHVQPARVLSPDEIVDVGVSWDGHSGPCVLVVDDACGGYPGGARFEQAGGTLVGANLTITWATSTPVDESMQLVLSSFDCQAPSCFGDVRVSGRSPFVYVSDQLWIEDAAVLYVDNDGLQGFGGSIPTNTPIHIEGTLRFLKQEEPGR